MIISAATFTQATLSYILYITSFCVCVSEEEKGHSIKSQ